MNQQPSIRIALRFGGFVLVYTLAATIAWWLLHGLAAGACIAMAKELHRLAGNPAPYLVVESMNLWWLAPPAQLLVGLVLASRWRPWPRRLLDLAICLLLYWFVTAMTVVLACSPYLGPSSFRQFAAILLTKCLLIILPIMLWGLITGLSFKDAAPMSPISHPSRGKTAQEKGRDGYRRLQAARFAILLLICLLPPITCWMLARTAPADVRSARSQLARRLQSGVSSAAVGAAVQLGRLEGQREGHDLALYYLTAKMLQQLGDLTAAIRVLEPVRHEAPAAALHRELEARLSSSHLPNAASQK